MKHLLNNLSNEEKNRIREQYEGGMSVNTSKFKKLLESTSGNVKPLIMEQESDMVITLPSDAPIKDEKGNYLKDDESLTLYNGDENTGGRGMVLFRFDLNDIPQIKDIPNVVRTPYTKDKKYWERINDFQIRLI